MNGIAAHKDELERLLVNLSGNTAVSGIGFAAFLNAYITYLDTNCSRHQRPRQSPDQRE
jgi:predicted cobalt transporter CbtA